ncbi:MAG TPA: hypothetical protein VK095_07465 [Beutenbergiaceae bacterium]|nr:hypothetical protein [Beutenbergiaceae bacterium]
MYALIQVARRNVPLAAGTILLLLAVLYGVGSVILDEDASLPPARVIIVAIAGLMLLAAGILRRRMDRDRRRKPPERR